MIPPRAPNIEADVGIRDILDSTHMLLLTRMRHVLSDMEKWLDRLLVSAVWITSYWAKRLKSNEIPIIILKVRSPPLSLHNNYMVLAVTNSFTSLAKRAKIQLIPPRSVLIEAAYGGGQEGSHIEKFVKLAFVSQFVSEQRIEFEYRPLVKKFIEIDTKLRLYEHLVRDIIADAIDAYKRLVKRVSKELLGIDESLTVECRTEQVFEDMMYESLIDINVYRDTPADLVITDIWSFLAYISLLSVISQRLKSNDRTITKLWRNNDIKILLSSVGRRFFIAPPIIAASSERISNGHANHVCPVLDAAYMVDLEDVAKSYTEESICTVNNAIVKNYEQKILLNNTLLRLLAMQAKIAYAHIDMKSEPIKFILRQYKEDTEHTPYYRHCISYHELSKAGLIYTLERFAWLVARVIIEKLKLPKRELEEVQNVLLKNKVGKFAAVIHAAAWLLGYEWSSLVKEEIIVTTNSKRGELPNIKPGKVMTINEFRKLLNTSKALEAHALLLRSVAPSKIIEKLSIGKATYYSRILPKLRQLGLLIQPGDIPVNYRLVIDPDNLTI